LSLPTRDEAIEILEDAGCCRGVVDHCLQVTRIAMRLAESFREKGLVVDMALVEAGALLHDLGRSKTHGIRHGVVGGQLAREMGLPNSLVRIIERHIGAGIPVEEAERLGLPRGNYIPETVEEKIVAYADKLVEGGKEVDFEVTVGKLADELGRDHPALDRLRALHEEIVEIVGERSQSDQH
jgi:uncharacterized protein